MTHFLDELPLDHANPGVQDLVGLLTNSYWSAQLASPLIRATGIPLARVNLNQPMAYVWPDVLDEARRQGRLRQLLDVVAESPDKAVALRVKELLARAPVTAVRPPREADWEVAPVVEEKLERQIESQPSLLDVSFMERGIELAPSVVRLLVTLSDGEYYGTGFRINEDLLLTNHHVLFDETGPATRVEAWFGYERSFTGAARAHRVIECLPSSIVGKPDHDWAVIRTVEPIPDRAEIIPLTGAVPPRLLDRVYIIQHPNGGVKKIGMIHNIVVNVTDDVVQYRTDTEAGSSGSPVFNENWQVVGLHHRWGMRKIDGRVEYYNQGRRIERVVSALKVQELI